MAGKQLVVHVTPRVEKLMDKAMEISGVKKQAFVQSAISEYAWKTIEDFGLDKVKVLEEMNADV